MSEQWRQSAPTLDFLWMSKLADRLAPRTERRPWRDWLRGNFSNYTTAPFGQRHERYWDWITDLKPAIRPRPRVEVWPRGGAKSTTVELSLAFLADDDDPVRHYALYVSATQAQANKHVQAVATAMERVEIGRATNTYGTAKGWKHTEIRTATGFNVTAFGLDSGMRGTKLDEFRPDIIIFDDIDDRHDTEAMVAKKIEVITTTILPAGSPDVAVIFVQNKIAKNSIIDQLAEGTADFLYDRLPAAVEPAVWDMEVTQILQDDGSPKYVITAGTPSWLGQPLEVCEQQINSWGLDAFLREAQHDVERTGVGLWNYETDIKPWYVASAPPLYAITVAIDPSTTTLGDEAGIIVAGLSYEWNGQMWSVPHAYVLEDASLSGAPKVWAEAAVAVFRRLRADTMVAERNNGGEMVALTIQTVEGAPDVKLVWASRGKHTRAQPVQKIYSDGRVHHVGPFSKLEKEMTTWQPGEDSPNRLDALVWAITDLIIEGGGDFSDLDDYESLAFQRS